MVGPVASKCIIRETAARTNLFSEDKESGRKTWGTDSMATIDKASSEHPAAPEDSKNFASMGSRGN